MKSLLCGLFCFRRARWPFPGFDVSAKFLPHGGKHFLGERMLLPRAEAHVQRRGQHIRWHDPLQRHANEARAERDRRDRDRSI